MMRTADFDGQTRRVVSSVSGEHWQAARWDFVNEQESLFGCGKTEAAAIRDLIRLERKHLATKN